MLHPDLARRLNSGKWAIAARQARCDALRGDQLAHDGEPTTFGQIVGQTAACDRLRAAIGSATARNARLDHILLASGQAGVGKTTLARVIAAEMGVGITEVSGPVSVDDARRLLRGMADRDILFWDEFHLAVAGGKAKAEWLLPLMQSGFLATSQGREPVPNVTIVAATTDAQSLPTTVLGRFPVQPQIVRLTEDEQIQLCWDLASRLHLELPTGMATPVVAAANSEPRQMKGLLVALRDGLTVDGEWSMDRALTWCGLSHDGLTELAQDFLITLLAGFEGQASLATIQAALGEPGPLRHTEQMLSQRGYIRVTSQGREITDAGTTRAYELARERGLLTEETT